MKTKTLYVLVRGGGDGSFNTVYTFDAEWIAKMNEKDANDELDYDSGWCDGDGFHYDELTVPDECTLASLGIKYDAAERVEMVRIKTIQSISVQDWDQLVRETYGRPYSFQQQDGCKERGVFNFTVPSYGEDFENDTIPEKVNGDEMGVSFKAWLARDPEQKLNTEDEWDRNHGLPLFWKRNFYPCVDMLIDDLHAKGLLPAGEYQIVIDW